MAISSLTASVRVVANWDARKAGVSAEYGQTTNSTTLAKSLSYTTGTGAGQADEVYSSIIEIAGGGSVDVDLSAALANILGDANIALARIKAIMVRLLSAAEGGSAASSVVIGGAAENAWLGPFAHASDAITLKNGGVALVAVGDATGWVVSSGTADVLKIANGDGAVAAFVQLTLFGASS